MNKSFFSLISFLLLFLLGGSGVHAGLLLNSGIEEDAGSCVWDLLDEDCSDISDWADGDVGTGVSEVSPAGQFRFDTNAGAAGNAYAYRYCTIASTPNTFTYTVKTYSDDIGTRANNDQMAVKVCQTDETLHVAWDSDGLFIEDTDSGWVEVGTDIVLEDGAAEWQYWYFLVTFTGTTGDGTCDVYYKNESTNPTTWTKVGTGINCSLEAAGTDGRILFWLGGYTTDHMVFHTDCVKIATGLCIPSNISPPTVTTQAVDGIGDDNATGHGTITATGGENATSRGICWDTASMPTTDDSKAEDSGSYGAGAFSKSMTSLGSGTTYYVRAYAINSAGTSYGNQVQFDTTGTPPPGCSYYVDTGGDDGTGNGTSSNPWLTVGYTLSQSNYGEVVCVNDGTYAESQLIVPAGVNIRSTSENATKVIIESSYSNVEPTSAQMVFLSTPGTNNPAGNTISHLTLDGNGTAGAYSLGCAIYIYDRDNVEICNCTIKDYKWTSTLSKYNAIKVEASAASDYWYIIWPDDCGLDGVDTAFDATWPAIAINHIEGFSMHSCNVTNCGITSDIKGGYTIGLWCVKDSNIYNNIIDSRGKPGTQCLGGGSGSGPSACLWNVDIYDNDLYSGFPFYNDDVGVGTMEMWMFRGGCEFYNNTCNHGWSITCSKNLEVHDNIIDATEEPDSCICFFMEDNHYCHSWGIEFDVANYGRAYNNYIKDTLLGFKLGTANQSDGIIRDTRVYNNIIVNPCSRAFTVYFYDDSNVTGIKVYNNTIDGYMSVDPDVQGNCINDVVGFNGDIGDDGNLENFEFVNNLITDIRATRIISVLCKNVALNHYVDYVAKYNMYDDTLTSGFNTTDGKCTSLDANCTNNTQKVIAFAEGEDALGYKITAACNATDAGTDSVSAVVTDDYWGTGRPVNSVYDIGAHEYSP